MGLEVIWEVGGRRGSEAQRQEEHRVKWRPAIKIWGTKDKLEEERDCGPACVKGQERIGLRSERMASILDAEHLYVYFIYLFIYCIK